MKNLFEMMLRVVIVTIFSILLVCVTWQVITRYALGVPSIVTDELARFLFMWLALIGGAYTYGMRRHLAIDLLTQNLTGRRKLMSEAVVTLIVALFAGIVMVRGGGELVMRTLASGQVTPSLRLPMGYIYGAIPFSGVIILFYCGVFGYELANGRMPKAADAAAVGGPLD
ncbi:MAG: TRAP transporter small permease [Marinosulfonomonas sp.]|nr:TRAP transporter small permease [Marinosulfonomonas sp.]